jgi:hypothetical protein
MRLISPIICVCITLALLMFLSACSPTSSPDAASPTVDSIATPSSSITDHPAQNSLGATVELPDPVAQRLISFLAAETGVRAEAIALQQSEPMEWNNACLGISSSEEFCAEVVTPGYRVVLSTPAGEYVVHTDQSGQTIRLAKSPS